MLHSRTIPNGQDAGAIPAVCAAQRVECDEVRLVGRIAAGDVRAFETLYRAYCPRLTRFLEPASNFPGPQLASTFRTVA